MSAPIPLRRDFDASQLRSLARRTNNGPQARRLLALAAIYEQFTEGFDTADLREATALMQDLKRSLGRIRNECSGKTDKASRR